MNIFKTVLYTFDDDVLLVCVVWLGVGGRTGGLKLQAKGNSNN